MQLYQPPPPAPAPEKPCCVTCRGFAPDVLLPAEALDREGEPVPLCWLCAHLVTAHDACDLTAENLGVYQRRCTDCVPADVYPAEVLARREQPPVTAREPTPRRPHVRRPSDAAIRRRRAAAGR